MEWIKVEDRLPEELDTVWAYDKDSKIIALTCVFYYDGWQWVVGNGTIYLKDGKILRECELDDYNFTHWMPLPEPPKE